MSAVYLLRQQPIQGKEVIKLDHISEAEFMFIWEPALGPDTAWSEYCWYSFFSDLDEIDFGEDAGYGDV